MQDLDTLLAALVEARAALQQQLEQVDRAIGAFGKPQARTQPNKLSLRAAIQRELRGRRQPTRLLALVESLVSSGFKSGSRNFRSNVSAMLSQMKRAKQVKHHGEAGYTLR